jgi:hypothetical protein
VDVIESQRSKQMGLFGSDKPAAPSVDEQAIARYRYMLKTAPPETIEQAHAEAFAQLTGEQRRLVLQTIGQSVPASERALAEQSEASPQALARMATRAEIRQPGAMERMFGQAGGVSLGGLMAGSLLSSIAGTVIGSMIAREFFANDSHDRDRAGDAAEDSRVAEDDHAIDDGDNFDSGGGFDEA